MTASDTLFDRKRQSELGQFLTEAPIAEFMASLFNPLPRVVRLLDAGAGAGALTAAFVSRLETEAHHVEALEATLYEVDAEIIGALYERMKTCERACAARRIRFSLRVHECDFIREMSALVGDDLFRGSPPLFNLAIVNPPYRKITATSAERHALRSVGIETSNLYTGFIALIQRVLVPGGQLVAITPRSFCNGPYFQAFREEFLNELSLRRLHVFESRQAVFSSDNVLQENIIFHAVKDRHSPREVIISSSSGERKIKSTRSILPFSEVVHPEDKQKFIHIPSAVIHTEAKNALSTLRSSLASLGLRVSTGRIVEFRLKNLIRKIPEAGSVPLIYPCHFNGGLVHWPKLEVRKPNAIVDNDESRPWLVPSGIYLLTKRFTSKEERRRLVACIFDSAEIKAKRVGFENHLNYFHADGCGLERNLARGLWAYLNSTVVDQYFRRFSGHTQVNATDLTNLRYPSRKALLAMGRELEAKAIRQEEIDSLLRKHLHDD